MRLSTVFVSSALVFSGLTTTLAKEWDNVVVARFAGSDFLAPIEARAYDKELGLYARGVSYDDELIVRGNTISNDGSRGGDKERKYDGPPKYQITKDDSDPSPQYDLTHLRDNWSAETGSARNHDRPKGRLSDHRRSLSEPPLHELTRRRRDHSRSSGSGASIPNRASDDSAPNDNRIFDDNRAPNGNRASSVNRVPSVNRIPNGNRVPSVNRIPNGNRVPSGNRIPNGNRTPIGNNAYHRTAILYTIHSPNSQSTIFRRPPHRYIL